MTRCATAGHLVSLARYAPKARQPLAGQAWHRRQGQPPARRHARRGRHRRVRAKTFQGSRYRRLARRRGQQRALVAAGNSLLVTAWHLLPDPEARFTGLGPGRHHRLALIRRKRQLIAELERLSGKKVLPQEEAVA